MKITLTQLTLENFKGIPKFTLEPGNTCVIKGANATGKTTLIDAFLWLLFNKDSQGKADFALKTLKNGQEIPNLEHSVEGMFDIDSQALTLKKVLKEKYTKKRGNSRADFTGHTTDYYIDGVPVQKKEWDQQIQNIIDEETFKLLTSPTYFNSLHWEKRRSILLEVCGDISDSDVIASDKALALLPEILNHHAINEQKAIIAAQRKEINQRLTEIPSRIDELDKSLSDVSSYDVDAIQAQIKDLDGQIQAMKDDTIRSNLRKQKAELQAKLSEIEMEKDTAHSAAIRENNNKLLNLDAELILKLKLLKDTQDEIARKENQIKFHEQQMEVLRNNYAGITKKKADVIDTCPACGQALPKDQVQDAIKRHNEKQASRLADINSEGKRLKNENERLKQEIEDLTKKSRADEKDVKILEGEIEGLKAAPAPDDPFDMTTINKVKTELQDIEKKLADNLPPDTGPLEEKRRTLQTKIAEIEAAKKTRTRIEELKTEEKKLAAEYENLEGQMSLLEKFITSKVGMLEEKINSRFSMVQWKLFDIQINQGISECCTATVNGVPWDKGLNHGAQINGGLDIIKTFSAHYNVKCPVWIDRAESVTEILPMDCQMIKLKVDEHEKSLKVAND